MEWKVYNCFVPQTSIVIIFPQRFKSSFVHKKMATIRVIKLKSYKTIMHKLTYDQSKGNSCDYDR